jgi:hypothetical protein
MRLVRLQRMAIEILDHGEVRVRRPDRDELLAIRGGALSYDELLAEYKRSHAEKAGLPEAIGHPHRERWDELATLLDRAIDDSKLPDRPLNRAAISDWLVAQRMNEL